MIRGRLVGWVATAVLLLGASDARADFADGERAYRDGNFVIAFTDLQPAAEQGDARAQLLLGRMYWRGQGVDLDLDQAVLWTLRAAEQGLVDAEYWMGRLSFDARHDYPEATRWYLKAAERGQVEAQYFLALNYAAGLGIAADGVEAARWYRRAAENGSTRAAAKLGIAYLEGKGVERDYGEALVWSTKAAEKGHAEALETLGTIYARGLGVPPDAVRGHALLNLGIERYPPGPWRTQAEYQRDLLAGGMTPDQLGASGRFVKEWEAAHP